MALEQPTGLTIAAANAPKRIGSIRIDLWLWVPSLRLWCEVGGMGVLTHEGFVDVYPKASLVHNGAEETLATVRGLLTDPSTRPRQAYDGDDVLDMLREAIEKGQS